LTPEHILNTLNALTCEIKCCLAQRQRQQVIQMTITYRAPAQMLRHQHWLNPIDDIAHTLQMLFRKTLRRADAKSDAMHADGIIVPQALQHMGIPSTRIKIIFGMHFQPIDSRTLCQKFTIMRRPQSHAKAEPRLQGLTIDMST
jgi:hypothetical protein